MKYMTMGLVTFFFLLGIMGCASADFTKPSGQTPLLEGLSLSAQDHLKKAQDLEQEIERLADQMFTLDQRMKKYQKKPYLDTKGFRRSGLKLVMGSTMNDIKMLNQQIAWHREEASKLAIARDNINEATNETQQDAASRTDPAPSRLNTMNQS